jgi:hypothetical protein
MERIEAFWIDEVDGKHVLRMATATKRCQATLTDFTVTASLDGVGNLVDETGSTQDEFKGLMDEIGNTLSKFATKSGEIIEKKRKVVLKGLRDWIDKELN